jgi:hypothetical protein
MVREDKMDDSRFDELCRRVEALEQQNRRWKIVGVTSLAVLGLVLCLGCPLSVGTALVRDRHLRELQAERAAEEKARLAAEEARQAEERARRAAEETRAEAEKARKEAELREKQGGQKAPGAEAEDRQKQPQPPAEKEAGPKAPGTEK